MSNPATMSTPQQNFNTGQSQEKAGQWVESTKNSANVAMDKSHDAAKTIGIQSVQNKEEATSFLQQTGEQVKNVAQGAVNTMKKTLGVTSKM